MYLLTLFKWLLFIEILILPLLPPVKGLGFEEVKVLGFLFLTTILGFLWLLLYYLDPKKIVFNWTKTKYLSILFIATLFLASLTGINIQNSFVGTSPYFQGWIVYLYLFLFSLLVSSVKLPLRTLGLVFLISSLFVSVIALKDFIYLNFLNLPIPNYNGRVISTFGQPNFYSGFLVLALPWLYFLKPKSKKYPLLWLLFLALVTVAILLSLSKGAILSLLILLIIFLLSRLSSFRVTMAISFVGIILISAFISLYFSSGLVWQEIARPQTSEWLFKNSPEKRILIWPIFWEIFLKKPFLGYGLGNIDNAFKTYEKFHGERSPSYYSIKNLNIDSAHNYLLDLLIFSGLAGFLVFLILVINLFLNQNTSQPFGLRTQDRRLAAGMNGLKRTFLTGYFAALLRSSSLKTGNSSILTISLITYLIWSQFQNQSIVHLIYFWLIVGLIDQNHKINA